MKIKDLCVITGKVARYRTREGIPYFDSTAYKAIAKRNVKNEATPMDVN